MGLNARVDGPVAEDVAAIARLQAVPRILEAVAHLTGLRFAAVARVTDTSWTACAVYDQMNFGLQPGGELALETTICNEIRHSHQPVIFGHASVHPEFRHHPTPKLYGFESYVSVPIFRTDGSLFGTLCAIDSHPAVFKDEQVLKALDLFGQLIGAQLEVQERAERAELDLQTAHATGELRDQFIAVLGHDLRNPMQAISMASELLQMEPLGERARRNVMRIQQSVGRMVHLVHDVLDFARGRLGGGIPVSLYADKELAGELLQVVEEVRIACARPDIQAHIAIEVPVVCDRQRMAQLVSNLLTNAVTHGEPGAPIRIEARAADDHFSLAVHSRGTISDDHAERLFRPFTRAVSDQPRPGLGLGLYIAAEIARAHDGTLSVESIDGGTVFRFSMPCTSRAGAAVVHDQD
ncbi:GAF domain-containing protein [Pseudoxanthomonas gei]|uniref:histidine kinase n=1 Tax=Pseudoxanthomonas gei TaxID=1383030 RepID=A0ABX0AET3_9GAMM|nr:GAF domain-containing sensor histidine kinase [Pseudoxanthomonas gei]NDK40092.1 GAF domain-containing protein [Pseudoxanthomonas gei]